MPLTEQPMRRLRSITRFVSGQCVRPSVTVFAYKYANFSVRLNSSSVLWCAGNVSTRQHSSYDSSDCSKHGVPPRTLSFISLAHTYLMSLSLRGSHMRP